MKPTPNLLAFPLTTSIAAVLAASASAQNTYTWKTTTTSTAWINSNNWTSGPANTFPGVDANTVTTADGNVGDIALFTTLGFSGSNLGINFNNTGTNTGVNNNGNTNGSLTLGALDFNPSKAFTIGKSDSSTFAATLTLNGATINSVADTIIRNQSGNTATIAGFAGGSGSAPMSLALGNATSNIIQIDGSGGVTISSNISGTGRQLTRQGSGSGVLTLSGNNTFSGGLNYSGLGILALQNSNAAGTGTITLASTRGAGDTAATFTLAGGINVANNIVMDSATGRNTINAITSGSNTLSGNITINNNGSGNQIAFNNQVANSTLTIGGTTPNSTTLTAATYSGTISFRSNNNTTSVGVINSQINAPSAQVNLNNEGVWTINSTGNSWSLTSLSTANSKFILGANDALATGARLQFGSNGGQIDLNGFNQTVAGLVHSESVASVTNNSTTADSTLTLAGLSADRAFAGAITDGSGGKKTSLVINNSSASTQTLSGSNTYTGATLVSAGTLLVNGSLGNTAVTVGANGILGGTGSLGGSLAFDGDSFLQVVNISDALTVGGTIAFGSGFGIDNLLGINWDSLDLDTPYTVLSTSQTFGTGDIANFGFDNRVAVGSLGREAYFTSGSLNVVVVPEPGTALLGGLGLLALLRRRRGWA